MPAWLIAVLLGCIIWGSIPEKTEDELLGVERDEMGEIIIKDFVEINYSDTEECKRWIVDESTESVK